MGLIGMVVASLAPLLYGIIHELQVTMQPS